MKDLSLNQILEALGLTTRPAPKALARKEGSKHILRGEEILFTGTAGDVWAWLGARADITPPGSPRFDGFQAAADDHFRDGSQSDEWLRGWDGFKGLLMREVERMTAEDETAELRDRACEQRQLEDGIEELIAASSAPTVRTTGPRVGMTTRASLAAD